MSTIKKKRIAAAVLIACGAPLMAQAQTSVTVYGKLYPQITSGKLSGATNGSPDVSHTVMESPNARLGFRGTESLGGGMSAFFQLETALGVDDGSMGATNTLFSRNTFVGLRGGFGAVKLGKMDTVYKELGDTLSFLGVSSGNFVSNSNVLSKAPMGDNSAASFHLRRNNSIMYESPEFGGFQGHLQYSLGEVAGDTGTGSLISGGVIYETGPFYFAIAHERHEDFFGASRSLPAALRNITGTATGGTFDPLTQVPAGVSSTDTATRLTAQYKITNATRVEANIARLEYDESGGAVGRFSDYRKNAWSLGAEHKIGAFTLAASYARSDDGSGSLVGGAALPTAGMSGNQINLGASYALSKRTYLFAIASNLKNDVNAQYNNTGQVNGGNVAVGQDIRQIALGVSHSF